MSNRDRSIVNVISISGGKDSLATALVAIERGTENLRFVFADTGNEHQITYDYVDYLDGKFKELTGRGIDVVRACFAERMAEKAKRLEQWLIWVSSDQAMVEPRWFGGYTLELVERYIELLKNPTGIPFLDLCIWKSRFPGTRSAFCTTELKHEPLNEYQNSLLADFDAVISWQGVRRDESLKRRDLPEKDIEFGCWEPEPQGMLIYRPILDWEAADTFEIATRFGFDWNKLYSLGMGRVGCMFCINENKQGVREINRRFPEMVDKIEAWERIVSSISKRGCSTFMDARTTAKYLGTGTNNWDIRPESHGIRAYVDWAMTERGGRQASLINAIELEDVPTCSSVYGLCE